MAEWWSIEVLHGELSAYGWQEQHDSAMIEAALTNGARDGAWHAGSWGVIFEVLFETEEQWQAFRNLPAVRAALDGVPDPVNGLLVYRGRGGGADTSNFTHIRDRLFMLDDEGSARPRRGSVRSRRAPPGALVCHPQGV